MQMQPAPDIAQQNRAHRGVVTTKAQPRRRALTPDCACATAARSGPTISRHCSSAPTPTPITSAGCATASGNGIGRQEPAKGHPIPGEFCTQCSVATMRTNQVDVEGQIRQQLHARASCATLRTRLRYPLTNWRLNTRMEVAMSQYSLVNRYWAASDNSLFPSAARERFPATPECDWPANASRLLR